MASGTKTSVTIGPLGRWDQFRLKRMTIAADQAKYLLENHMPLNQPLIPRHKQRLCKVLLDGHWKVNGETIIFDRNGHLKDGQHRLAACAETGISIDTAVAFGVEPDVFDTIGRCKPRSVIDDLGLDGEINVLSLASSLRLIYVYDSGERSQNVMKTSVDSITLREFLRGHPEIRSSASFAQSAGKSGWGISRSSPGSWGRPTTCSAPRRGALGIDSLRASEVPGWGLEPQTCGL